MCVSVCAMNVFVMFTCVLSVLLCHLLLVSERESVYLLYISPLVLVSFHKPSVAKKKMKCYFILSNKQIKCKAVQHTVAQNSVQEA